MGGELQVLGILLYILMAYSLQISIIYSKCNFIYTKLHTELMYYLATMHI